MLLGLLVELLSSFFLVVSFGGSQKAVLCKPSNQPLALRVIRTLLQKLRHNHPSPSFVASRVSVQVVTYPHSKLNPEVRVMVQSFHTHHLIHSKVRLLIAWSALLYGLQEM